MDLGTEFGVLARDNGDTVLQVFKGQVSVSAAGSAEYVVAEHSARRISAGAVLPTPFNASATIRPAQIDEWLAARKASPFERWKAWSEQNRRDPAMIAYYTFEPGGHRADRLPNLAWTGDSLDGTLSGNSAKLPMWVAGR